MSTHTQMYNVGGVLFPRPFKATRLGHFGLWQSDMEATRRLYVDLLGFFPTDTIANAKGETAGLFTSHGTDHHSLVGVHRSTAEGVRKEYLERGVLINQISFQVSTLEEVTNAHKYFVDHQIPISRIGRDFPGSNWAVYCFDPDGHRVEFFYGMEQIGWTRNSKPSAAYRRIPEVPPPLPQPTELWEVLDSKSSGVDIYSGFYPETAPAGKCDVGGVLLPRPFKVKKVGPVKMFVADMAASERFYLERAGLVKTEEVVYCGHRCVFLRVGTEHHCLALFPVALRQELGFNQKSTLAMLGLQLGSYAQLKAAIAHLKDNGLRFIEVPPELHPGIDYAAHFVGHDNHCIELHFQMEQIGWDGKPRPADRRRPVATPWPETLEGTAETYSDQLLQGPMA